MASRYHQLRRSKFPIPKFPKIVYTIHVCMKWESVSWLSVWG